MGLRKRELGERFDGAVEIELQAIFGCTGHRRHRALFRGAVGFRLAVPRGGLRAASVRSSVIVS